MIEAALTMLTFLVTMIGILDFSQVLFFHQSLTERVRDGLRYGVVRSYNQAQIQNMVVYGNIGGTGNAFPGLTTTMVNVQHLDSGTDQDRITIRLVGYQFYLFSPLIAKTFTNNWAVAETMPVEYVP
jgi:hypothetical protein